METKNQTSENQTHTLTVKALFVGFLILLLLIPGILIQNLIEDRQTRRNETIHSINEKWSNDQTLTGPVLCIPFHRQDKPRRHENLYYVTPENLDVNVTLFPEERYYGMYKAIVYKSRIAITGDFLPAGIEPSEDQVLLMDEAYILIGVSDLKGVTQNFDFMFKNRQYQVEAGGSNHVLGNLMRIDLKNALANEEGKVSFECNFNLNGSGNINFVPLGKNTTVEVSGDWKDPGFVGNFTPDYVIEGNHFKANWSILSLNRTIPSYWIGGDTPSLWQSRFGVNLVETVDHYQQNMRSAKYAIMFLVLTFTVFFFMEILTRRKIHVIQYLLVGIALVIFYTLLLSISEQIGFVPAYAIASLATIGLITMYTYSIFRNKKYTGIIFALLCGLYTYLFVILQLEDGALLIGSIGLFLILAAIMYFSRDVNWYQSEQDVTKEIKHEL